MTVETVFGNFKRFIDSPSYLFVTVLDNFNISICSSKRRDFVCENVGDLYRFVHVAVMNFLEKLERFMSVCPINFRDILGKFIGFL